MAVVPDSQNVESERESRTRDACSAVKSMQDWEVDVESIGLQRFKARAHETEMMTVGGRISECVVKQTVDVSVETQDHDVEVVKVIPQERIAERMEKSRSHRCMSRKSLRTLRSRWSRVPRHLRVWAQHLSAKRHRWKLGGRSHSSGRIWTTHVR